jgi:hypothetical protein
MAEWKWVKSKSPIDTKSQKPNQKGLDFSEKKSVSSPIAIQEMRKKLSF